MSEHEHRIEELESDVAAAEAEVERLRLALERIFKTGRGTHVEIARDALNA